MGGGGTGTYTVNKNGIYDFVIYYRNTSEPPIHYATWNNALEEDVPPATPGQAEELLDLASGTNADEIPLIMDLDMPLASPSDGEEGLSSMTISYEVSDIVPFTYKFTMETAMEAEDIKTGKLIETSRAAVRLTLVPTEEDAVIHGIILPDGTQVEGTEALFLVEKNGPVSVQVLYDTGMDVKKADRIKPVEEKSLFSWMKKNDGFRSRTLTYEVNLTEGTTGTLVALEIEKELTADGTWDYLNAESIADQSVPVTLHVAKKAEGQNIRKIRVETLNPDLYQIGGYYQDLDCIIRTEEEKGVHGAVSSVTYTIDNRKVTGTGVDIGITFAPKDSDIRVGIQKRWMDTPDFDTLYFQATEEEDQQNPIIVKTELPLKRDYPETFINPDEITIVGVDKGNLIPEKNGLKAMTDGTLKQFPRVQRYLTFHSGKEIPSAYPAGFLNIPLTREAHMPVKNLKITLPFPEGFAGEKGTVLGNKSQGWVLKGSASGVKLGTNIGNASPDMNPQWVLSFNANANSYYGIPQEQTYIAFCITEKLKAIKSYFENKPGSYIAEQPISVSYDQIQWQENTGKYEWVTVEYSDLGRIRVDVPKVQLEEVAITRYGHTQTMLSPSEIAYKISYNNTTPDERFQKNQRARTYKNNGKLRIAVPKEAMFSRILLGGALANQAGQVRYQTEGSTDWKTGTDFSQETGQVTKIEIPIPEEGIGDKNFSVTFYGLITSDKSVRMITELSGDDYPDAPHVMDVYWHPMKMTIGSIRAWATPNSQAIFLGTYPQEGQLSRDATVEILMNQKRVTKEYQKLELEFQSLSKQGELSVFALLDPTRFLWSGSDEFYSDIKMSTDQPVEIVYTTRNYADQEQIYTIPADTLGTTRYLDLALEEGDVLTSLKVRFQNVKFENTIDGQGKYPLFRISSTRQREVMDLDGTVKEIQEGKGHYPYRWVLTETDGTPLISNEVEWSYTRTAEAVSTADTNPPSVTVPVFMTKGETNKTACNIKFPLWDFLPDSLHNSNQRYNAVYPAGSKIYLPMGKSYRYVGTDKHISVKNVDGQQYLVYDISGQSYTIHQDKDEAEVSIPAGSILCVGRTGKIFEGTGYVDFGPTLALTGDEAPYIHYNSHSSMVEDRKGLTAVSDKENGISYNAPRLLPIEELGEAPVVTAGESNRLMLLSGLETGTEGSQMVVYRPVSHDELIVQALILVEGNSCRDYQLTVELPRTGEETGGQINQSSLYLRDLTGSVAVEGYAGMDYKIQYLDSSKTEVTDAGRLPDVRFVKVSFPEVPEGTVITVNLKLQMPEEDVYMTLDGAAAYVEAHGQYKKEDARVETVTTDRAAEYEFHWDTISGIVFEEGAGKAPDGVYGAGDMLAAEKPELQYRLEGDPDEAWKSTKDSGSLWKLTFDPERGTYTAAVKPQTAPYQVKAVPPEGRVLTWSKEGEKGSAFPCQEGAYLTLNANADGLSWEDPADGRAFDQVNIGYYHLGQVGAAMAPSPFTAMVGEAKEVTFTPAPGCAITKVEWAQNPYAEAEKKSGNPTADSAWVYQVTGKKSTNQEQRITVTVQDPFVGTTVEKIFTYTVPRTAFVTFDRGAGTWKDMSLGEAQKTEVEFAAHGQGVLKGNVPGVVPPANYTFEGWKAGNADELKTTEEVEAMITSEGMVLTAQYALKEYKVSFQVDGDKGIIAAGQETAVVKADAAKLSRNQIPAVTPVAGFVHIGWKAADGGTITKPEGLINLLEEPIDQDLTFVAVMGNREDFTEGNGGILSGESMVLTQEELGKLTAETMEHAVLEKSGASAWNVLTAENVNVTASGSLISNPGLAKETGGIYQILLQAEFEGITVNREILAAVEGSRVAVSNLGADGAVTDQTTALYAEPFWKAYNDEDLNEETARGKAKAAAYRLKTKEEVTSQIQIGSGQLEAINQVGTEGTGEAGLPLTFSVNGAEVEIFVTVAAVTVKVTVDANDPINRELGYTGTLSKGVGFDGIISEDGKTASLDIALGKELDPGRLPEVKEADDSPYVFKEWVIWSGSGYVPFEASPILEETRIFAHYVKDENNDGTADEKQIQFVYQVSAADAAAGHGLQETGQSGVKQTVEEWRNVNAQNQAAPAAKVTGVPGNRHYEFVGWTYNGQTIPVTEEALRGTVFERPDSGAIAVTAVFRKKQYEVSFAVEGGNGTVAPESVMAEAEKTLGQVLSEMPEVIPGEGYVFAGWAKAEEPNILINLEDEVITEAVVYVAVMKKSGDGDTGHGSGGISRNGRSGSMGKWLNTGWIFVKAGGQKAVGEQLTFDGNSYCFTENGFLEKPEETGILPVTTQGVWIRDGWRYELPEGGYLRNGWYYLRYQDRLAWYYFDKDGWMLDGWLDDKGNRYYLHTIHDHTRGHMYEGWHQIDGMWYYFYTRDDEGITGAMARSGKTPDGYTVDENGVWDGRPAGE